MFTPNTSSVTSGVGTTLSRTLDQSLDNVVRNLAGYASGAVQGWVQNQIDRLRLRIPSEIEGILSFLLRDSTMDPLQNLMYRVQIGGQSFDPGVIQGVNIPQVQIEYRSQKQKNRRVWYPTGNINIDDLTITFLENRNGDIASFFDQNRRSVYNPETGRYNLPGMYKKDIQVSLLGYGNNTEVIGFKFKGCSPASGSTYNMSIAGGSFITPSLTWKVDDYSITVAGQEIEYGALEDFIQTLANDGLSIVKRAVSYVGL